MITYNLYHNIIIKLNKHFKFLVFILIALIFKLINNNDNATLCAGMHDIYILNKAFNRLFYSPYKHIVNTTYVQPKL